MSDDPFSATLDLLRRLPPTNITRNTETLCALQPDIADDLITSIDQPLLVKTDRSKEYLCTEYNKDGDSYRSPWSNTYSPELPDGTMPSSKLRELEVMMNDAFDTYREQYYEGGISSVYLWDLEDGGFAGAVLLKKTLSEDAIHQGSWDSIHIFECRERGRQARYSLTSTILLWINTKAEAGGSDGLSDVSLSGSMTRQIEQDCALANPSGHIANVGKLVEDMEIKMRNLLAEVYFGKTKDVINELRSVEGSERRQNESNLRNELLGAFKRRAG